jgi:PBP1b-binding outer membrane lipoprotein LpoB
MKKRTLLLLLLALIVAGCNNEKQTEGTASSQSDTLQVPKSKYLSEQQLQDKVNQEIKDILSLANDDRIEDAIKIIAYTEEAVNHILDSNYTEATAKLEDAIGKAAVMIAARPDLSLFPLDVQITTRDLVADIDMLKQVKKEAEQLTDKGYLQAARHLLENLASELEITTPMLPVASYPNALSSAAKALSENNADEALIILNTALSTVFVETRYVPLPLIRAERMLEEVSTLLEEEGRDTDINTLLENAEYQIRFAEALGYGKKDKEFEELYSAIKEIKQELKKTGDGDSSRLNRKLRDKLNAFKERISKSEETNEENKEAE